MEELIKLLMDNEYKGEYDEAYCRRGLHSWSVLSLTASDKNIAVSQVATLMTQNILLAQIANDPANAKKPEQIKLKMVEGRISKFYDNNCLLDMTYVKDDEMKVCQYVAAAAKEMGGDIKIVDFYRFEKGEGIQKREENFADEIAKLTGNN